MLRYVDRDAHEQIAVPSAAEYPDPFPAEAEDRDRLGARRNMTVVVRFKVGSFRQVLVQSKGSLDP